MDSPTTVQRPLDEDAATPSSWRISRQLLAAFILGAAVLGLFAPVIWRMINEAFDYLWHVDLAARWSAGQSGFLPHFLFQALVIGGQRMLPMLGFQTVGLIVSLLFYLLLAYLIIYRLALALDGKRRLLGALLALLVILSAPISLVTLPQQNLYLGYLAPSTYHNPTVILLKPLALLIFYGALRSLQRGGKTPVTQVALLASWSMLALFAKPNFTLAFLPAVAIFVAYKLVKRELLNIWPVLIAVFVPSVIVLAWQFLIYQTDGSTSLAFSPFTVMAYYGPGLAMMALKFALSILFPALVALLYFRDARRDNALVLAWLTFGFAALQAYLFIETGADRWFHANFVWGAQVAVLILFITSLVFWLPRARVDTRKFALCSIAFGLHIISGLLWYAVHLTPAFEAWW